MTVIIAFQLFQLLVFWKAIISSLSLFAGAVFFEYNDVFFGNDVESYWLTDKAFH